MKKLQRGLPKGRYSKYGYKRNSPDVNKPFNIIPSGRITMQDVDFPVRGVDNLGNEQIMYPGLNYIFPGSYVLEIPMMQPGGQTNNDREMVEGIADILTMVKDPVNRRQIAAEMVRDFKREGVKYDLQEFQKMAQVRMQRGGLKFQQYYTPAAESTGANYTPTMTVQAAERLKTQRDAQELARRKQAIQASQAAASKPLRKRLTPENLAQETGATGDKLRFFPNDPDSFIDDYLNPLKMVGDMASGLGRIPLNVKQGNYGAAALDVAIPVATGALAGFGAKSAGQFVNNLANPLAGTGQFLTTKTPLKNAYKYNPWAFKPKEGMMYRGIGKEGMEDAIQSGVFRQKAKRPPGIPDESGVRLRGKGFGETYFSPEFSVADRYGKGFIAEVPKKSGEFKMSDSPNHASGWSQYVESPIPISEGRILQKDWLRGYKEVPKPKQLPGAGNLAANAAAKSSIFGDIKSGLQDLVHIYDQSLGYLFNNRANKKAIAEGNEWLRNWIQHPTTQAKIDKDFAGKINNSFVKNMYDVGYEQAKNFTPVSTELPLSVQLAKGFYPNKGNWGVSYLHHVDPMRRRMIEQGQMDAPIWHGSFISRTLDLPYKKRVGTTIHEGTHDWTNKFGLEASGQREFLERNINPEIHQDLEYWRKHGDDKTKTDLGKKRRYQAYLADPTEQHARIMELRKYLGHTPDFVSTPEYAQKVMDYLSAMRKNKRPIDSEGLFKVIDNDPQKLSNMFNRLWGVTPVAVAGAAAASKKQDAQPTTQEYQNGGPAPTYFGGTLPEVMISSDGTSYPYYNKLTAEEKKYFNQNSPIGRAVRSIAFTGKRGKTANDLGKIARGVEEFAAEMTGIPGSIRFSQDPVKKLKGLGRTVEATILGSSPFITAPYNKEDVADTFDALDALGFATTTAGLAKMPLQKAANLTGRYLAQGPTINIPKQLFSSGNALNLEELRRVYHNSERVLEPEEARFLHKHGHGLRENYRTDMSNFGWGTDQWNLNNQLPSPPSEIQFMPDGTTRTVYNQQPTRYNIDLLSADYTNMVNGYAPGSSFMNYPNLTREQVEQTWRNLQNSNWNTSNIFTSSKPKTVNKSGLTKEEALQKASGKNKDAISKMSENEFSNTVLKPTGEIVPYESQADLMPHFTGSNNVFAMSPKEYADEFNLKLDLLNDIIAQRNKSGVEYRVKGLDESGRLTFYTPPGQKGKNPLIKKGLEDIEIPAGESIWSVGINPGEWRGNVEDIANTQYFRSIPGLEMRNTTNTVFSDGVPRKGTGAYEAINEYLKRLDLGRVKPGFNSQTEFSRGAWENFIKSGRGVGFYGNPNTIYGTMKTIVPPAAIGVGAYGVNQKQDAQPTMQKFGGNLNFQFGGYIPSWLNPMNWGVTDYTGKKDFNSAYAAARQAGEKEFMWNGKRFNTDYKGTPQQQLKETGLTNEQIQDRSKLNKNLTKNIYPYSYDNLEKRIWAAGVLGKKEENREAIDKDPRPYDKEKLDALNLYAGVPQKNNTFRISNYKPSTSKDNINYYTFNKQDDRFVKNLIDYAYLKSKGAIDGSAKDYDIDVKGLVPDQEKNVMGNYKMSTGKDDRGTYVSFYDKWDLAPMDFGKPFEIYDRIYTKDYSDGKQKRMYYTDKELLELDINKKNFDTLALQRELANRGYKLSKSTKKDGIFDGILGDETKAALEDWQKKNSKKQLGGALLKAQFGAFGTIPTSPPFMPQKENVVTSKKVDNLPKIKVNTTVPDEMITIKDGRKIRLTTGQAVNPNTDLVGKSYSTKALRSILNTAKNRGLSKNDALTLAAMDLQETRWGETDNNMGHVIYKNGFARSPAENFINAYLKSKETADRLKLSDEYTRLQVYNGLGKVTPNTEKNYHGFRMKKIYGVPVPESGIDMKKNPLYGKQIVDIRDNVLKQNSEFLKLVDEYYKMGGITNEMLDVYKNYINGVYTNTEKEKDAIKVYDKLNRKYYREAKNANKSVPNYIMSLIK